ncbi:ABC transporter ATP-binding protein [Desulfosarcina ovata subsp. sediminis]|uniref:ABC transporter ATP-binding protein n=1 Tax=Desulfosarcina ovata subsp. sediminis TaxID=885957 RepID=A0A5K8A282_9BACT|nr:ABC transporter ATP-binding protein [Desulfosarcina ovata subsp. sediminis]
MNVNHFFGMKIKNRHRDLLSLIKKNSGRLILAAGCSLLVSASTTAMGYLIKPVIDDIFVNRDTSGLLLLPLVVIAVFLIKGVGSYGQEYFMNYVGEDIIRRLRNQLYDRIQDLSLAFFQKERTGTLMSRITNDVNILKSMVSTAVTSSLRDISTIIGLAAVILYQNWRMAILAFIVLPAAFWPVFILGRKVRRVSTGCQQAMADLNAFLHETFAGNKIVKAFGMEQHEKQRFFDRTSRLFDLEIKGVIVQAISSPVMEFFGGLGIAFVIWYGGSEVIAGKTTPGTFMSFLACVLLLYDPVKKISRLNNSIQRGMAAADRVFDIIETPPDIIDPPTPHEIASCTHNLYFENVSFSYGDQDVLSGVNISVNPGEVLALVGMSGGGKSTLANLIPRFYDVTDGKILIDGIDIRQFAVADLRRQIAIVTQEPILFNETVRDNIAYGRSEATEEQIVAAARAAFAHDFIMRFPSGYDTMIGELGGRLSGGEKQRLCIARALIKDAPILILDEATSSLDSEAEAVVQKALENLMHGRTTIVIAHRLSTIAGADHIAVIVGGHVVETGSHETLLVQKGEYFKLYTMQYATSGKHA